jgi:hypothetical protein
MMSLLLRSDDALIPNLGSGFKMILEPGLTVWVGSLAHWYMLLSPILSQWQTSLGSHPVAAITNWSWLPFPLSLTVLLHTGSRTRHISADNWKGPGCILQFVESFLLQGLVWMPCQPTPRAIFLQDRKETESSLTKQFRQSEHQFRQSAKVSLEPSFCFLGREEEGEEKELWLITDFMWST